MRRQARHVSTEEMNAPCRRLAFSADQTEERRLSGAVRPNDGSALAGRDCEAHTIHRVKAVEGFRDVGKGKSERRRISHAWFFLHRLIFIRVAPSTRKIRISPLWKRGARGDFRNHPPFYIFEKITLNPLCQGEKFSDTIPNNTCTPDNSGRRQAALEIPPACTSKTERPL
jgi:hypothetical protein